jgi:hypothetical protein
MYITGYFCVFIKETDNLGFDINNGRGYLNSQLYESNVAQLLQQETEPNCFLVRLLGS